MKGMVKVTRELWVDPIFGRLRAQLMTKWEIVHCSAECLGDVLQIACKGPFIPKHPFTFTVTELAQLPFGEVYWIEFEPDGPNCFEPYHVICVA